MPESKELAEKVNEVLSEEPELGNNPDEFAHIVNQRTHHIFTQEEIEEQMFINVYGFDHSTMWHNPFLNDDLDYIDMP